MTFLNLFLSWKHDAYKVCFFFFFASMCYYCNYFSSIFSSFRLSSASRRCYTLGEMCNLMAVDVQKVFELIWNVNQAWSAPLRVFLVIVLLWQYLGVACLAGVAVMVVIMPITAVLASRSHQLQSKQMTVKDARLRQMAEILNGIKVLKLYAWEIPFMEAISKIRDNEATTIRKLAFYNAVVLFLWSIAPFLVALVSFITFVLIDEKNVLDPNIAFVSITLFYMLRFALSMVPDAISEIIQSRIAFQRLKTFLISQELKADVIGNQVPKGTAIIIEDAYFSFSQDSIPFLEDINLRLQEGALIAVVGRVGAGKTVLLSAMLGELYKIRGSINIKKGTIGYVAQQAWIQNATVKDNILFLKKMDFYRYSDVIDRCALREDLKIFPAGDETEIGEKGVTLSGGQKQRISLARALYQDADIYFLDDPLSAVDCHVRTHIFNQVIGPNGALKYKARILVTHDLSVLPNVDLVLVMANGKIQEVGSYQELMSKKGEFAKFVEEHLKKLEEIENDMNVNDAESIEEIIASGQYQPSTEELKMQMKRRGSQISRTLSRQDSLTGKSSILYKPPKPPKLVKAEKMETGRVKASIFITYFRYCTICLTVLTVICFIFYQIFEVGSNIWLSKWSSDQPLENGKQDITLRNIRIAGYGILGIGQGACILIAAILLAVASTRASIKLHYNMLISVLHSPMAFFDCTPVGRILNRFGKDISVVDSNIPAALNKFLSNAVAALASVVVIATNYPVFLLIMLPISIIYVGIQSYYLVTSRQVRRLQSTNLSPVFSHFSETIQGTSTIRGFRAEAAFIEKEDSLVDTHIRGLFHATLVNRWLSIRLEFMGSIIVLVVAILTSARRDYFSAGIAALTLTYALNITGVLATLVKFYTNLEIRMVAVERIAEYTELPSEAPWKSSSEVTLPENWPTESLVSFRDYKMRYNKNGNYVLNGIQVDITPKEKVGIVGRTGAGKTTFALALFRIVEPSDGAIYIDGVDICSLGLHDLRSKLTIIPQDPVLFSGTLRMNLDPVNEHSDDKLWNALEDAHLKEFVIELDKGLDHQIAEGGENLSIGQRQQICLARALLKKTKILILDEATAAVDMKTDRLIQSTIRSKFDESTVITIAHRLYTILDYDRIIVMDKGKIIEEGKPDELLQRSDSFFFKLGKEAGLI